MANANSIYAHTREAVRVKVKKCELNIAPEWRKFSVDPQITSLEVLYSLLAKAFEIKSDFSIKYKAFDPAGNEIYLAVLSDWDLDAAFLRIHNLSIQTATEPCLILQIDIKPFTEVKEWDAETPSSTGSLNNGQNIASSFVTSTTAVGGGGCAKEVMTPLQQSFGASQKYVQHMQTKLPGLIMNQMEKTFSIVQKAFNLSEETMASLPPRIPLSDTEFRLFLDSLGQIQRCDDLRKVIFFGGIEPSLRRVVWKHILNVYPHAMNGKQRMDYMRRKSDHYYKLRDTWKLAVKQGCVIGELAYVTSMVKKDVLRTDRLHPFYAGSDDNQNIASLFNILTTYALNHPSVSYCQGMSDIASPLLVTMNDEAQAYICFCAIMSRVKVNFMLDGISMTQKFAHLTEALSFYDPEFWEYLKSQQADDLLFCYRWLLLELKREFPFEDALRMLEVQWSSLKYESNADKELLLYEKEFSPILETSAPTTSSSLSGSFGAPPTSPSYLQTKPRENPYTKVCALRRQSSSASLSSLSSSFGTSMNALNSSKLDSTKRLNQSLDDNISRNTTRRSRHASAKAHQSLDESKMLMLMEGLETSNNEQQSNNVDDATNVLCGEPVVADEVNDDDDDVFTNGEDDDNNAFNFHPTNPFIEDAQKDSKQILEKSQRNINADASVQDKNTHISNAFLSSSSSISDSSDAKIEGGDISQVVPKSIMKLHNKNIISNYTTVSNIIAKQIANATSGVDIAKKSATTGGGHFKDLKEKIAATSKRGMNFDDFNSTNEKSQQKLVKNFNEFLNFASINKSRISDKLSMNTSTTATAVSAKNTEKDKSKTPSPTAVALQKSATTSTMLSPAALHPLVQLTRSSFASSLEDSDSSSVPETTWSCSTAATAIQQTNNLSNNSLHLELNSLCSATPDKTPTFENNEMVMDKITELHKNLPHDPSLTPDDSQDQEYYPMSTAITRELRLEAENLDRQVFGDLKEEPKSLDIEYEKLDKDSLDLVDDLKENEIITCPDISELIVRKRERDAKAKHTSNVSSSNSSCKKSDTYVWENPLHTTIMSNASNSPDAKLIDMSDDHNSNKNIINSAPTLMTTSFDGLKHNPFIDENLLTQAQLQAIGIPTSNSLPEVIVPIVSTPLNANSSSNITTSPIEMATNASDEIAFSKSALQANTVTIDNNTLVTLPPTLPPPSEFGGGNPFLMFLCLTLLLQHRNTIIKSGMDYNEIAMHFDKMVRKHDVTRVLNQARRMYIDYLKAQTAYNIRVQQHQQQTQGTPPEVNADVHRNNSNATMQCYASSTVTKS